LQVKAQYLNHYQQTIHTNKYNLAGRRMNSIGQQLESYLASGNQEEAKTLLNQVKLALLTQPLDVNERAQAVAALEIGVLLAIQAEDLDLFGRTVALIQPYYSKDGPTTPRRLLVIGLHLMHLLVENRLSEFHSQLELLTEEEAATPFISFPVGLERQLMVGIYDEILAVTAPDASYQIFLDLTVQTVRDAIADCMEVSYESLTTKQAAEIMKFDSTQELVEYVQESRDDWILQGDVLTFQPVASSGAQDIPSMEWIEQSLTYATEMERIV
jgi:26S proteasome regulatory subunit N12